MKRIILSTIIMAMTASSFMSCSSCSRASEQDYAANETTEMENTQINEPEFDIVTTHGTMRVKLYSKTPKHRDNFVKLVNIKVAERVAHHQNVHGIIFLGITFLQNRGSIHFFVLLYDVYCFHQQYE